jgi:hypothetical protein
MMLFLRKKFTPSQSRENSHVSLGSRDTANMKFDTP